MEYWQAFLLALVEGITEFIPVSSTGHMLLLSEWLELRSEQSKSFIIFIQLGAVSAVALAYSKRIGMLCRTFKPSSQQLNWLHFVLAVLPAALLGALLYEFIKTQLFGAWQAAVGLFVGGWVMLLVDRKRKTYKTQSLDALSYQDAWWIGIGQCFALWPGVSRSGATIVAALLRSVDHRTAADFSFLLAMPIVFMAASYDLFRSWSLLSIADLQFFALGFFVAFIFAWVSVRWFLGILPRVGLLPFGVYRVALGGFWLWLLS